MEDIRSELELSSNFFRRADCSSAMDSVLDTPYHLIRSQLMKVESPEQVVNISTFTAAIKHVFDFSSRDKLRSDHVRYPVRATHFG